MLIGMRRCSSVQRDIGRWDSGINDDRSLCRRLHSRGRSRARCYRRRLLWRDVRCIMFEGGYFRRVNWSRTVQREPAARRSYNRDPQSDTSENQHAARRSGCSLGCLLPARLNGGAQPFQ